MKKNVFFALFAIVALAFVGCEPPVEPVNYTVAINTTELTLELNGTQKLTATVTPATTAYSIVWSSDNQEVVTVNASGIVTAVGLGSATITATLQVPEDDATVGNVVPGTCTINVTNDAALDNFALGGFALFKLGDAIPGTDTVLTISIGEVSVNLVNGIYYVWDENVTLSPTGYLGGAGFMFQVDAPTYVITSGDYAGYYIGSADLVVDTIPEGVVAPYCGSYGYMADEQMYGDAWKAILALTDNATSEQVQAAGQLYYGSQVGCQMFYIDFENDWEDYNYANVSYAYVYENEDGTLSYDLKLEWYDYVNPGRFYGLLAEFETNEEGQQVPVGIVEPYDMRFINKQYVNMPVEEPAAAAAKIMPKKMVSIKNAPKRTLDTYSFHKM